MPDAVLRTARLTFRPFAPEDLDDLARIVADPEVMRFVGEGVTLDRATAALWIARSRDNVARYGYGTGAVVETATNRMVGWAGFARPEGEPEEVVYGFARAAWGRGYATEILAGLVAYAFGELRMTEIRATVDPDNAVSRRVLARAGFHAMESGEPDVVLMVLHGPGQGAA